MLIPEGDLTVAMVDEIQQRRELLRLIRAAEVDLADLTDAPWESELGHALGDRPITEFVQAVSPARVRRWLHRLIDADNTEHRLRKEVAELDDALGRAQAQIDDLNHELAWSRESEPDAEEDDEH